MYEYAEEFASDAVSDESGVYLFLISVGRVVDHLEDTWKRQVDPWADDGGCKDMFLRMRELLDLHGVVGAES
jgi:hypothetical protein